jgi:ABC-type glycerol-3-phosphate transport system substrate-binding protein
MKRTTLTRATGLIAIAVIAAACGSRGNVDPTSPPATGAGASDGSAAPAALSGTLDVWTQPQGDDERAIKAIGAAFEEANPGVEFKLLVIGEDTYVTKVNTAIQAKAPPDVAALEDRTWMQAGKVVRLDDKLTEWGVDVADFNPGGIGRGTPKGTLESGLYGVGEFLGGNILVYNKALLDDAGVAHPPADRSLSIDEYAELCRAVAKPDPDPNKAIFGCSMPEWGLTIQSKDVYGEDGRTALGNMNSPEMAHAFDVGAALIRDKVAPSPQLLEAASESDLFASGRLGITWSDFTETPKYTENAVDFGLAPFYVIKEGENFVDVGHVRRLHGSGARPRVPEVRRHGGPANPADGLGRSTVVHDGRGGDRLRPGRSGQGRLSGSAGCCGQAAGVRPTGGRVMGSGRGDAPPRRRGSH